MNSIFIIEPKRNAYGVWAFDDVNTGLVNEPLVGETNTLIDSMAIDAGIDPADFKDGVAIMFAATPFPDYQDVLDIVDTNQWGTTYQSYEYPLEPWLCPAFFKYFPEAPEKLYAKVIGKN